MTNTIVPVEVTKKRHDDLCQSIVDWLRLRGAYACMTDNEGISDIVVCVPFGRFFAIEVKSEKCHSLSKAQKRFRDGVLRTGGRYLIAKSLDDVQYFYHKHYEKVTPTFAPRPSTPQTTDAPRRQ